MNQPLAYIHPNAKIGTNVVIDPFCYIAGDVEIGDNTWIGPNVTILDGARIGSNCKIFPGAVISAIPQDLKFRGEVTTAKVGSNTTIRECVTINKGTASKGVTKVGNNCLLMAYVHVAHDCVVGNNVILGNATQLAGEVEVDDFAILSGGCLVHQFEKIGCHTMVQGGSKVNKDIPPFSKVGREPLSYMGLNSIGLRRRNFSPEKIAELHETYRILYNKGLNVSQAIAEIEKNIPNSPEKELIVNFIKSSKRGVVKVFVGNADESDD